MNFSKNFLFLMKKHIPTGDEVLNLFEIEVSFFKKPSKNVLLFHFFCLTNTIITENLINIITFVSPISCFWSASSCSATPYNHQKISGILMRAKKETKDTKWVLSYHYRKFQN